MDLVKWDELFKLGVSDKQVWDLQSSLFVTHMFKVQGLDNRKLPAALPLDAPERRYPPDTITQKVASIQLHLWTCINTYNDLCAVDVRLPLPRLLSDDTFKHLGKAVDSMMLKACSLGIGTGEKRTARALTRRELSVGFEHEAGAMSELHPDGLQKTALVKATLACNWRPQDAKALETKHIEWYSCTPCQVDRTDADVQTLGTYWRWPQHVMNKNLQITRKRNKGKRGRNCVGKCCEQDTLKMCRVQRRNMASGLWEDVHGQYDLLGVFSDRECYRLEECEQTLCPHRGMWKYAFNRPRSVVTKRFWLKPTPRLIQVHVSFQAAMPWYFDKYVGDSYIDSSWRSGFHMFSGVSFYSGKHTMQTILHRMGTDKELCKLAGGHSSDGANQQYAAKDQAEYVDICNRMFIGKPLSAEEKRHHETKAELEDLKQSMDGRITAAVTSAVTEAIAAMAPQLAAAAVPPSLPSAQEQMMQMLLLQQQQFQQQFQLQHRQLPPPTQISMATPSVSRYDPASTPQPSLTPRPSTNRPPSYHILGQYVPDGPPESKDWSSSSMGLTSRGPAPSSSGFSPDQQTSFLEHIQNKKLEALLKKKKAKTT